MDALHFHLIITHFPVFASIIGALVLGYGIGKESKPTREIGCLILILTGIGAVLSNISGEEAEHLAEKIPGILESSIEEHEESVGLVLWTLVPSALISLAALWAGWKKPGIEKRLSVLAMGLSLLGFAATARTAWLGGQIRHTEISAGAGGNYSPDESGRKEEEHLD
jgi:hypothetical protein